MVDTTSRERLEREQAGAALRALRKRAGLTQEDAAGAAERISLAAWKNYERGIRAMDNPTLARALKAIGSNSEEFALERSKLIEPPLDRPERSFMGVQERGRIMSLPVGGVAHGGGLRPNLYDDGGEAEVIDFTRFFSPGTQVLRLAGMSMYPYAEPGGLVTYNVRQFPKRGHGCVIEMQDGAFMVKRFERLDDDQLTVTELYPVERELSFDVAEVKGVYAVTGRFD
jgi:phage repressor protein C with HTH and peptisase S24 domain